ncbi:MAG: hypothetical protein GWP10_17935 [Nitrospiraceae bacterium]|nr:hypothetical protein [Nitrospiraceae bacterium]
MRRMVCVVGILIVVAFAMLCAGQPDETIASSSDGITISGRVGSRYTLQRYSWNNKPSICASICVNWRDFSVGSNVDSTISDLCRDFQQTLWACQSWKGLTFGGSMTFGPRDWQCSGIRQTENSLYITIDLLSAQPLVENGTALISSSITYNTMCSEPASYHESSFSSVRIYSEVELGNLTLSSKTDVALASSTISETLGGSLKRVIDNVTVTSTAGIWTILIPLEVTYMKAGVSIERRRSFNDSSAVKDDSSCCSVASEEDGKLSLDLFFDVWKDSSDFNSQVSYVCSLPSVGISIKPYLSLAGRVDPKAYSYLACGVEAYW